MAIGSTPEESDSSGVPTQATTTTTAAAAAITATVAAPVVDLQRLFDYNRIDQNIQLLPYLWILMYFPFGLCLFIIRVFIGLHALLIASLLPKKSSFRCFILRTMCGVLGIVIKEENASIDVKSKTRVIVSNHITNIDHLAVDLVMPCIVPGVWDLPKFLNWGLGFHDFGVKQGRDVLIENVKLHLNTPDRQHIPILCYPEGATTNGRVGLLKFSSWLFTLDTKIQPIFINVWRPAPINVAVSVVDSRWWTDLFWFLFVPFSVFTIKYLPIVEKNYGESPEELAKRVQTVMATEMKVCPTNYTDADKVELVKRLLHIPSPPPPSTPAVVSRLSANTRHTSARIRAANSPISPSMSTRSSAAVDIMAIKVKEVLPQVPISVIQKDIKVTTNIDETITRLLDGTVQYVAERLPPSTVADAQTTSKSGQPMADSGPNSASSYLSTESMKPFYCGSKTFGKNANERTKSYQERKEALLVTARHRYLEKHGINNSGAASNQ